MATPTYDLLETITISSPVTSVTFTAIDQSYRDLVLVINAVVDVQSPNFWLRFNGDSGTNYNATTLRTDQFGASGFTNTNQNKFDTQVALTESDPCFFIFNIMDYSATDKHKSGTARAAQTGFPQDFGFGFRYASNSAITSINCLNQNNANFKSPTTFSLYGIAG